MKHKYVVSRSGDTDQVAIKEYAELDKEIFSLVYQVSYDAQGLMAAASEGKGALLSLLRTQNFFPPRLFSDRLAEATIEYLESDAQEVMEFSCDDTDYLTQKKSAVKLSKDANSTDTLDDLLDADSPNDNNTGDLGIDTLEDDIEPDKSNMPPETDVPEFSGNEKA